MATKVVAMRRKATRKVDRAMIDMTLEAEETLVKKTADEFLVETMKEYLHIEKLSSGDSAIDIGGQEVSTPSKSATGKEQSEGSDAAVTHPLLMPLKVSAKLVPAAVIHVQSNMYEIKLGEDALGVYRYDIDIVAAMKIRGEKSLTKGPSNDYCKVKRHEDCWNVFQYVVQREPKFFGTNIYKLVYDRRATLYWLQNHEEAFHRRNGMSFTITMEDLEKPEGADLRNVFPKNSACLQVRIRPAEQAHLIVGDFSDCISADLAERDRSVQQFLELVTSQALFKEKSHIVFGNKAISLERAIKPLGGGKFLASGFDKNVRFVGNDELSAIPVVQIDTKKTAFFSNMLVSDFASHHLKINIDYFKQAPLNDKQRRSVLHQLNGLAAVTHLNHEFEIAGVTKLPASDTNIKVDIQGKKEQMNVADYFKRKYNTELKYPCLPCVIERRQSQNGKVESYHPMEMVKLQPNQRVEMRKQTPEQVDKMIKECATLPNVRVEENEAHRLAANLKTNGHNNGNQYLANLQLSIANKALKAKGNVLDAPTVVYGLGEKQQVAPGKGDWKQRQNGQFVRPAQVTVWVAVLTAIEQRNVPVSEEFIRRFVKKCVGRGMKMGEPTAMFTVSDVAKIDEMLAKCCQNSATYILFISPSKGDTLHDYMKKCETRTGIVTQDIRMKTVEKCTENNGGADLVLDNIVKKTNLKLGGLNFDLESAVAFLKRNKLTDDILKSKWMNEKRLLVGLDVSHPPPLSIDARRRGEQCKDPSVVGLCVNAGATVLDFTGSYWFQPSRKESIVEDLDIHLANHVRQFKEKKGFLPESVVVFRDGVSEGQYPMVMISEQQLIRKALYLASQDATYQPHLTVIVVQKRTNYRLMPAVFQPTARKPIDLNLPPGTVVHSDLVHPTHTEFIITPQRAIQGTAKPIRCTVVVDDEPRLSLDELEGLTYALCYAHEIVNSPTSLPAPVFGAHELAKRGKNNFRSNGGTADSSSGGSGRDGAAVDDIFDAQTEQLDVGKHDQLSGAKFWA